MKLGRPSAAQAAMVMAASLLAQTPQDSREEFVMPTPPPSGDPEIAAQLRADRARRKAANHAKRQPKGPK